MSPTIIQYLLFHSADWAIQRAIGDTAFSLYHQINENVIAEDKFEKATGHWTWNNISVQISYWCLVLSYFASFTARRYEAVLKSSGIPLDVLAFSEIRLRH